MKALLIDPSQGPSDFIQEIVIDSWQDISPTIGDPCRVFDCVRVDENNTLYVDDEGLFNGQIEQVGYFHLRDYPQPLAGRGVILGTNYEGESIDVSLTIAEAYNAIGFATPLGPVFNVNVIFEE